MAKLKIADLAAIKDRVSLDTCLREPGDKIKIVVHMGEEGFAKGARKAMLAAMDELEKSGRRDIAVTIDAGQEASGREPLVTVNRPGEKAVVYAQVDEAKMRAIFDRHVLGGQVATQWVAA